MTITILKAVSTIVLLAMMIVVLLSMNHFLRGGFDSRQDDVDKMRRDLDETDEVISDESVFRDLVKVRERANRGIRN